MRRLKWKIGGRLRVAALALALLGTLIPMASVSAVPVPNPATGGSAISADQSGTSNFTTLIGPAIAEAAAGELAVGKTTILNVPAGFQFNAGVGNTSVGGGLCAGLTGTLVVTATTATHTVTTASSSACILTFVGLQVQPTAGTPLATGNITKTGTSLAPGAGYGTLTEVAGAVAQLVVTTQPSANSNGGTAFATQPQITAIDQFTNFVVGAPVALAITPGTGAAGAALTCTTNPQPTNGAGRAIFTGCLIDKAGSYRLRGSVGSVFVDTGNFTINVGPPTKLVFTSYPAATTPALLSPQPAIAVADAGGNTVTTFPATNITLAINQNGGTFSCTGGLAAPTVAGVATFAGCTQTTVASGYMLTGTIGFANVLGPNFAISPPVLTFIAGPGAPTASQPFPTNVQVAIQNGGVTLSSGISATVTLAIGTNPGGGTLACTGGTSVGTISGVATFTGCSITNAGTGYTLVATASNVVPASAINAGTSAPFNVSLANPALLTITTFCGTPTPKVISGPNACAPDTSKSPPQANIKLPQTLDEGVWLQANIAGNGAGRSVTFQFSKDNATWTDIVTTTTDGSGNASTFYRPSDNRFYRVTFAGASDLGAGTSGQVRVVVRALVFIRPTGCTSTTPCRVSRNRNVTFSAIARPNRPELPTQTAQFTLQRRSGSTWTTVSAPQSTVSKATGEAQLGVTFNSAGSFRIRVNLLPTPVNANSFPTDWEYYSVS